MRSIEQGSFLIFSLVSKQSAHAPAYQPLTIIGEYVYLPAYLRDIDSFLTVDEYAGRVTEAGPLVQEFTLRIKELDSIVQPDKLAISYTIPMPVGQDKMALEEILSVAC